jgi:hypothetical protein
VQLLDAMTTTAGYAAAIAIKALIARRFVCSQAPQLPPPS